MRGCVGISHGAHWQSMRKLPWKDSVTTENITHPTLREHHRRAGGSPRPMGPLVLAVKGVRVGL